MISFDLFEQPTTRANNNIVGAFPSKVQSYFSWINNLEGVGRGTTSEPPTHPDPPVHIYLILPTLLMYTIKFIKIQLKTLQKSTHMFAQQPQLGK